MRATSLTIGGPTRRDFMRVATASAAALGASACGLEVDDYLMHCHKLEHEDMGMMSNFEVA